MLTGLLLAAMLAADPTPSTCAYSAGPDAVAVDGQPFAAQPSSDGCWLFVSLAGDTGGIAVLHNEGGRFAVTHTVRLPGGATGLALTHDGRRLLVASGTKTRVLNVDRLQRGGADPQIGELPDGDGAATIYVAASADDRLVFASDEGAARITVFDLARAERDGFDRHAVIGRIAQGAAPVGLALSPDGAWLYATSERVAPSRAFPAHCRPERGDGPMHPEGALSVIDVAKAASDPAHSLVAGFPAGCNPVRVAVSQEGRTAWVTARGEDAVYAFTLGDPAHASRVRMAAGDSPVGIAVQPGTNRVWVSNSGRFGTADGDVQTVGATTPIRFRSGHFPRDLRLLPDERTLVVAVFGSKAVQLIPTPD